MKIYWMLWKSTCATAYWTTLMMQVYLIVSGSILNPMNIVGGLIASQMFTLKSSIQSLIFTNSKLIWVVNSILLIWNERKRLLRGLKRKSTKEVDGSRLSPPKALPQCSYCGRAFLSPHPAPQKKDACQGVLFPVCYGLAKMPVKEAYLFFAKNSFVIEMTTPERPSSAIRFGIAIRPLSVSAISQTRLSSSVAPMTTAITKITL